MASNNGGSNGAISFCKLCELSGEFEASEGEDDPIVEIVKAAGAKFLPWEANRKSKPMNNKDLSFQVLSSKMDGLWHTERFINFRRDEIVELKDQDVRAKEAEDHISGAVR